MRLLYIPLILSLIFLFIYIISSLRIRSIKYNPMSKLSLIGFYIDKILPIKKLRIYLVKRLLLINISPSKIGDISVLIIITYFIVIITGVFTAYVYGATWYVSILIIVCFCALPMLIFNLIIDIFVRNIVKELPLAVEEISQGFKVYGNLKGAIKYAVSEMDKHSASLFNKFSYSLEFEAPETSINRYLFSTNNKWLNMLGILFLTYTRRGGDLSHHLDYFVDTISYYFIYKDKNKYVLFMPKVLLIVFILVIPVAMKMMSTIFPAAEVIYKNDTRALNLIALCIGLCFISFIALLFIERR